MNNTGVLVEFEYITKYRPPGYYDTIFKAATVFYLHIYLHVNG